MNLKLLLPFAFCVFAARCALVVYLQFTHPPIPIYFGMLFLLFTIYFSNFFPSIGLWLAWYTLNWYILSAIFFSNINWKIGPVHCYGWNFFSYSLYNFGETHILFVRSLHFSFTFHLSCTKKKTFRIAINQGTKSVWIAKRKIFHNIIENNEKCLRKRSRTMPI